MAQKQKMEITIFRFQFVVRGLSNAILSADIGHSFTDDPSIFDDFDDLTFAESGSFQDEAPANILLFNSSFLLGIFLGVTYRRSG